MVEVMVAEEIGSAKQTPFDGILSGERVEGEGGGGGGGR